METITEKEKTKKQSAHAGKIPVRIVVRTLPADTCTPVGLYLRLRDRVTEKCTAGCSTVLLESADNAEGRNSRSIIATEPIANVQVKGGKISYEVPQANIYFEATADREVPEILQQFLGLFEADENCPPGIPAGLIGYTSYDAVRCFEKVQLPAVDDNTVLLRYSLYRTLIVFDHLRDTLRIVELLLPGDESTAGGVETVIFNRDVPRFSFEKKGEEISPATDERFLEMVEAGKAHCRRGDVFQVVLSRQFTQKFSGDEFNVYRALRMINPSPYLFFADYGDYRIFGSSPEAQLVVQPSEDKEKFTAVLHPIAGTFRRSGSPKEDRELEEKLLADPKENAEHVMLVDLARNDLSRSAKNVKVDAFREVHRYSHVIHLVSKVSGETNRGENNFRLLAGTFPAGTLSGAPKIRAMQIIAEQENVPRGFYGGCIGFAGFDGSLNQAIMIRSFISRNGELVYRAGAGIVAASEPEKELQEINNKLEALRLAMVRAEKM
ncbi:MAG TPA: chorismate-binding protein [Bacteroidia bacterium]|nr:chorismate-binding protein [Bacteroidia bacterium]